jgi:hypothetical protein
LEFAWAKKRREIGLVGGKIEGNENKWREWMAGAENQLD